MPSGNGLRSAGVDHQFGGDFQNGLGASDQGAPHDFERSRSTETPRLAKEANCTKRHQRPTNRLTTNHGVPLSDNQNSLKAGRRGPTLLEDFVLREKIQHFDHERIPERIVHARGSAAHGYFELTEPLAEFTRAKILTEVGVKTELFNVSRPWQAGAGSVDTPRDVRGFAVKVLHQGGQLGPRRQQYPGVLHSGRDQVSRPDPCRQDGGGRSRLSPGGQRP